MRHRRGFDAQDRVYRQISRALADAALKSLPPLEQASLKAQAGSPRSGLCLLPKSTKERLMAANPSGMVHLKLFQPWGAWSWYATGWHPGHCDGGAFFGLVRGDEIELGYFSLGEIAQIRGPCGLRIERDLHWRPRPVEEVRRVLEDGGWL